jgi:hypothetical protein
VHAPVHAAEVRRVLRQPEAAQRKRVEQADLDVRMRVERREQCGEAHRAVVIEQQAHPHAALGGIVQRAIDQVSGQVVAPDVVLRVDRPFRRPYQQQACGERVTPVRQRVDARKARMRRHLRCDRPAEPGMFGVRQRAGCGASVERRQRVEPIEHDQRRCEEQHGCRDFDEHSHATRASGSRVASRTRMGTCRVRERSCRTP